MWYMWCVIEIKIWLSENIISLLLKTIVDPVRRTKNDYAGGNDNCFESQKLNGGKCWGLDLIYHLFLFNTSWLWGRYTMVFRILINDVSVEGNCSVVSSGYFWTELSPILHTCQEHRVFPIFHCCNGLVKALLGTVDKKRIGLSRLISINMNKA